MPTTADSLKDGLARVGLVSMGPDETANKDNGDLNLVFDPQNKVCEDSYRCLKSMR